MRIFIGSSREATEAMEWVALCLEGSRHELIKWTDADLFALREATLEHLLEISRTVDAAIFIVTEGDRVWYRADAAHQVRDNVLIEWGIFTGALGPGRCTICTDDRSRTSIDSTGLPYLDISGRSARAKFDLNRWALKLKVQPNDAATLHLMAKIGEQDRELEFLNRRLAFGNDTIRELQALLTKHGVIDFSKYDLAADGHWKLLFDFDYFWSAAEEVARLYQEPAAWRSVLRSAGAESVASKISWKGFIKDRGHASFFIRKSLRIFRSMPEPKVYVDFLGRIPTAIRGSLDQIASTIVLKKSRGEDLQEFET
jgi:hypothetical protein